MDRIVRCIRACPFELLLAALVAAVYAPVAGHPFIDLDDQVYVFGNPNVSGGLSLQGVAWAVTTGWGSNWHPVTWLSHLADVSLFGMNAGRHHLVSASLHAANAILLFAFLRRATGRAVESGMVAALFAVHPLHVESVAWISERKDLLCGFFFLSALIAYARYRERPSAGRYAQVLLLFALALMSKPMAVTLPFVLLLLDRWPFGAGFSGRLLVEKVPMFLMSLGVSAITAARAGGSAVASLDFLPARARVLNAMLGYAAYLGKAAWPAKLAVFYPIPRFAGFEAKAVLPALFLAAATCLAAWQLRKRPWIAVGWFWYLGMLVPVIGFVQAGMHGMADRYAYLPLIGVYMAVVRAGGELVERRPALRAPMLAAAVAAVVLLGAAARHQLAYWSDSVTLFSHAADAVPGNWLAHDYLAIEAARHGRRDEARRHLLVVLEAGAPYNDVQYAIFRRHEGQLAGQLDDFLEAVETGIRADAESMREMGLGKAGRGRLGEAEHFFRQAVRIDPAYPEGHYDLGVLLAKTGRKAEALPHFREALRIAPVDAESSNRIGVSLAELGRWDESVPFFREALRMAPAHEDAAANLESALRRTGASGSAPRGRDASRPGGGASR